MFLVASKVLWALAQPVSLTLLFVLLGLLLSFTRLRRTARVSLVLGAGILGLCAFTSFGYVAIGPLENRFSRPALPAEIDGIIVLGGGMDADVNTVRSGWELNRSGDRFVEALRLAKLYPGARVIVSGGGSVLSPEDEREADAGARFFEAFGIPRSRLVLEAASRNTEENAQFTREALGEAQDAKLLLVTSAFHMPRAMGLFRKAGLHVVPWPADYLASGTENFGLNLAQPAENLSVSTIAIREWLGLVAYWVTGRIDELVPAPE